MGLISFIGFTALVAIVAYLATRNTDESTADGFYLGGRSLTAVTIAGSLLLTNLSTEQIVGLNGQAYSEGVLVMAWETLAAIAMVLTALFLLPRYLKDGLTTIPEFIEKRFDTGTKSIVTLLFLSGYMIVLIPSILYSGSLAFSNIFDLPVLLGVSKTAVLWICTWSIGLIGMVYAIFGGLKAVAVSDLVNAVGLLIGGVMIPIFGLSLVGDGSMVDGINTLWTQHPEKFNARGSGTSSIPFGTIFTGMMLVQMFYWGTNQAIIQRVFAAKNLKEGQKGLMLAAFIKFLGPLIVVLPGIIAFHLYGDQITKADEAYPILVRNVLPTTLVGFFAAVLFGAVLSSFNSAINSCATLFGFDLYKEYFKKDATEQQSVKAGKVFGISLAVAGMCIAPLIANAPDGLFAWLQEANGCYSIPILSMIVIGYFTKKVPAFAAKIGLLSGVILYSISQFAIKPMMISNSYDRVVESGIVDSNVLNEISSPSALAALKETAILKALPNIGDFEEITDPTVFAGVQEVVKSMQTADFYKTIENGEIDSKFLEHTKNPLVLAVFKNPVILNALSVLSSFKSIINPEVFDGVSHASTLIEKRAYPHFLHVMAILFVLNMCIMMALGAWKPMAEDFAFDGTGEVDITSWKYAGIVGIGICIIVVSTYFIFT